jgi:hypothetical protein
VGVWAKSGSEEAAGRGWCVAPAGGVPILVPEIVLLYKAHELTEKDEADFRSVLPHLTVSRKAWLLGALDETRPDHPWARRLRG